MPIASLKPYPGNARIHDLAVIRESLRLNGQYRPVVVRVKTRHVLAGNGTMQAAIDEGWTELWATFVDVDAAAAKRINVVDNRANDLAGYDEEALAKQLRGIPSVDGTGYSERELVQFLARVDGPGEDTAPSEPPAKPKTKPGDLWLLGEHRLLCGDATNADDVKRVLASATPALLVTDPPYGVELEMEWRDRAGFNTGRFRGAKDLKPKGKDAAPTHPAEASYMRERAEGHTNTGISGDSRADWSEAFSLVPSLTMAYVWHADRFSHLVGTGLERVGFDLLQMVIWDKQVMVLSRTMYHFQHEPCWVARRRGAKVPFYGAKNQTTIWSVPSPKRLGAERDDGKFDHPTQKPLELYERPLANHLAPGEAFYEPFCGSGSGVVAAENTGRVCLALEVDPRYCDVIVERWERHTGKKATRGR